MSYIYDLADTWNDGATTFTSIKMNVTDTASAAASLLMDLQVGGSSRFNISKTGVVNTSRIDLSGPLTSSGVSAITNGDMRAGFGSVIGWTGSTWSAAYDTILTRRAAANLRLGAADVGATTSTVTITIAAPGVVTWTGHGFSTGTPVVFTTTGALPTGITAGTTYYAVVVDANTFQIATSVANAIAATPTVITTSGTQSGTHTGTRYNITQRLGMQSITGVTDRLGADLIIQGSQGTGTGAGGSIVFQVAPAGSTGTAQNALATALTISSDSRATFAGRIETNTGVFVSGVYGADGNWWSGNNLNVASTSVLSFGAADTILRRDAANTLALRNGANAQAFNVYNTFTDTSNYERFRVDWASTAGRVIVGPQWAGTGTAKHLYLAVPSGGYIFAQTTGAISFGLDGTGARWDISSSGHFLAGADNTYDIGASGGSRPRNVYVANVVHSPSVQTAISGGGITLRNSGGTGVAVVDTNGSLDLCYATALPAGGTTGRGLRFSSNTTNFGVFFGSGAPTLSAAKGSLYLRSDGTTTNDRMYVNTDGATTWTAVTTAA